MKRDVILVDVIESVISEMVVANPDGGNFSINYQYGRSIDVLKELNNLDNSVSSKGNKYPLIAMIVPIRENRGSGFYATAKIDRIVIATITKTFDGNQSISERYNSTGTFKTVLYPLYYEFLKRLAFSPYIIGSDPDNFVHTKIDNPGKQPIGEGLTDFIDSIEILNLEIILNQIKTCKS